MKTYTFNAWQLNDGTLIDSEVGQFESLEEMIKFGKQLINLLDKDLTPGYAIDEFEEGYDFGAQTYIFNKKTKLLNNLKALYTEKPQAFVTYGDGDLGMPIEIAAAIKDFESFDWESITDEWKFYECDEDGEII